LPVTADHIKQLAGECGFELAGVTLAVPHEDFARFEAWRGEGFAGEMNYLTDRRGDVRRDPRHLLPQAASIVCVGKLYNTAQPHTNADGDRGWISRYAWGCDYHEVVRAGLIALAARIRELHGVPFESRVCVDTAPLLERSYARAAGLGWIGKNTCLINQQGGSWFFLGELLLSIPLSADSPPADRCGSCRRCIDACPTMAIVADGNSGWTLDSRRCISYLTIEKRGPLEDEIAAAVGGHIFGCDICQDVCPWNRRAGFTDDPRFAPAVAPRELETLSALSASDFQTFFRNSPVWRAKYEGFLRNVAVAMGNSGSPRMMEPLQKLASHPIETIARTARYAAANLLERFAAAGAH
jgi:epoxyqueuosine reductase